MKPYHVVVAGTSGGGKSTLLREMFAELDGVSVWVRRGPNDDDAPSGYRVRGTAAMQTGIRKASSWTGVRLVYQTSGDAESVRAAVSDVRQLARQIHDVTGGAVGTQMILDEAHGYLPDAESESGPGNPIRDAMHEDRDNGLKVVLASQDPTDLYYPPLKQAAHIVWVGETRVFNRGFLRYFGLDSLKLPNERFRYVVIKPTDPPEVVYRGETNEEYA